MIRSLRVGIMTVWRSTHESDLAEAIAILDSGSSCVSEITSRLFAANDSPSYSLAILGESELSEALSFDIARVAEMKDIAHCERCAVFLRKMRRAMILRCIELEARETDSELVSQGIRAHVSSAVSEAVEWATGGPSS